MIKMSVFYPNKQGGKFDIDYYLRHHIPMVQKELGAVLKSITVEQGVAGVAPGTPAAFMVLAHLTFDSVEAFQAAFGPRSAEILADVPKYTDIEPIIQLSEVKL